MPIEQKEEYIEGQILEFLMYKGAMVSKIVSEGYFDSNKGIYRKRKSAFSSPGISDILGCIEGRHFAIEVKTPSEMKFFDRTLKELIEAFIEAQRRGLSRNTLKKYSHAVDQRKYIDDTIRAGGIAFFASSIEEVKEGFKEFNHNL